jgi:hypothetical protein
VEVTDEAASFADRHLGVSIASTEARLVSLEIGNSAACYFAMN